MEYRAIGNTDLRASVLGLGTSKLASVSSELTRAAALDLIMTAADHGINLIDTADIYGQGDSERIVGEAIRGKRDRFIIATKAGYRLGRAGVLLAKAKPYLKPLLRPLGRVRALIETARDNAHATNVIRQDFSPEYLTHAVDRSLRRLRTDYVDILYLHDLPLSAARNAESFECLSRMQKAGKIRHVGISPTDDEVLEVAQSNPLIRVIQTDVHPWRTPAAKSGLSSLGKSGRGVVANRVFAPMAVEEWKQKLEDAAQAHGMTTRQLLLNFALQQPYVGSVLTGTISREHLLENIADLSIPRPVPLDDLVP
ncbi:aldo/keto reductase [Sinorhizobium sp. BG8]|uniref:aldo/keto reductase n=1 Tax=Sinorhizobium sp. BG8 TaxID=2613773 RepID=UPI001AFBF68A|nr:aldo/keto reductase [Sinorhizobium sp. BG8]QRM57748.1 aldo/keto reductase [Sinorhizobium sp. BG8]